MRPELTEIETGLVEILNALFPLTTFRGRPYTVSELISGAVRKVEAAAAIEGETVSATMTVSASQSAQAQ